MSDAVESPGPLKVANVMPRAGPFTVVNRVIDPVLEPSEVLTEPVEGVLFGEFIVLLLPPESVSGSPSASVTTI